MQNIRLRIINKIMYFVINLKYFFRKKIYDSTTDNFLKDGFIQNNIPGIANEIDKLINSKSKDIITTVLSKNDKGIKLLSIDLHSKFLWKYIFNEENFKYINSHFKGKFFLRNAPVISYCYDGETHGAQHFHLDWGLRQLSLMVNLSNVDKDSTHMQYIKTSNKGKFFFKHPNRLSPNFKKNVSSIIENNSNLICTTQASKDTSFIFDAGNGLHRQVGGGYRMILHLNFTDNLAHTNWDKNWKANYGKENWGKEYWIQKNSPELEKLISDSPFPDKVFSLMKSELKPNIITPLVYSSF